MTIKKKRNGGDGPDKRKSRPVGPGNRVTVMIAVPVKLSGDSEREVSSFLNYFKDRRMVGATEHGVAFEVLYSKAHQIEEVEE